MADAQGHVCGACTYGLPVSCSCPPLDPEACPCITGADLGLPEYPARMIHPECPIHSEETPDA